MGERKRRSGKVQPQGLRCLAVGANPQGRRLPQPHPNLQASRRILPLAVTIHRLQREPLALEERAGDVVREVSEACRAYGLRFGIYLSPWDRHEQSYGTDEYNEFFLNQLTELLTGYGPICEVWFDGACGEGPNGKKQNYDTYRWYSLIRRLQPSAVIAVMGPDARWVGTENGIGRETEWSVIPNPNIDNLTIAQDVSTAGDDPILMPNRDIRDAKQGHP